MEEEKQFNLKKLLFGRISRKVIFILSSFLLVVLLIMGSIVYFQNQILKEQFINAIIETEEDYIDLQEGSIRTLSSTLEAISRNPELKKVYLEKDREKLFNYGQPLFQELKNKYQITHFYFILPDGHNFVRLHNQDKYGDLIQRATFLKAKETKNVGAGIELGKTAYALRAVMPYYNENELIGYIELGQEIDEFLEIMKKEKPNQFSLIVKKEYLIESDWESSREVKGLRNNWNDLEEYIEISSTTEETFSCLSDENADILKEETTYIEKLNLEDKIFACGGFSIMDASGEKSGTIFSLIDVTEEQKSMYTVRYVILFMLIILISIVIWAGHIAKRKISKPIEKLKWATEEIEKGNFNVKVDIKTGDELEKLGESFNKTTEVLSNLDKEKKQVDKAKTEFLSITSHELRSPMTPMLAQLQMMEGDYFGKLNTKQKESLDIVLRNTKRLDNIIKDFLEISRIEAARLKFKFVKTDLTKTIKLIVEEMEGFLPEKRIKIITEIEKLPIITADPDRIGQVLRNLINNAIKFTKENGKIIIRAKQEGNVILFSVQDNGVGISKKDKERLFEPFYQADNMYQHKSGGTGLGLAIIRGIVESQGGKVWIESELRKGSKFLFTVPLIPVKKIKQIKLLFSDKENGELKLKKLFKEILGPIGENEFENFKRSKNLNHEEIKKYIYELSKNSIISKDKTEEFKKGISQILQGKDIKLERSNIKKRGPVKE
ncbi:HAMP domain-containing protein [Candidatus Woesearchaeota archaeon]|jgi:signal transduction histidine kinase|nr:HAMP domain-containing protein [Candidatus Woesearchaeota archaeon]MBT4631161.1 HAMP domain-containing protein [Candidatus Woesearchaeota archaeon]